MDNPLPVELPSHNVLAQLARDDPSAYEELRRDLVERFIDNAPEDFRRRLRGLQFRVDAMRRLSGSGLGATLRVYGLMWESFARLNDEIADLAHGSVARGANRPESARILEFRRGA